MNEIDLFNNNIKLSVFTKSPYVFNNMVILLGILDTTYGYNFSKTM
ncbi:hypothetical protein ACV3V0_13835 [Clostridium perfringens]